MEINEITSCRIAVIGSGNMGGALLKGWARHSAAAAATADAAGPELHLTATAHTQRTLDALTAQYPAIHTTLSNADAVTDADVVVLAVKPWLVADVLTEIRPALLANDRRPVLISVAANITSGEIQQLLGTDVPCVYAMPNIAAEYGQSMTFVEQTPDAASTELAAWLMGLVGEVRVVAPRLMGPGMMMAGCGIAYVMRYLRAMMEGGVEMGFYPADARQIALQTMQGAVSLLQETGMHPEVAIDKVTTPGGITIRGLNELDHSGFNSAVIRSLKAGL